jgi:uncharacterized protein (UPF0276 family)
MAPAWLCGDAGLWHFGARDRGHMLLLPPVLTDDSARAMADGIRALREHTGREVIPENPPGAFYLGDLHLLDFYARLADYADTGLLLDLATSRSTSGRAAARRRTVSTDSRSTASSRCTSRAVARCGRPTDSRSSTTTTRSAVLDEVWPLLERVAPNAPNLKAVVLECERQSSRRRAPALRSDRRRGRAVNRSQRLQRLAVRMLYDRDSARAC